MSFRARLTLFFVLIVVVPLVVGTVVVFRLIGDSETGKAQARLAQAQTAAVGLYDEEVARAGAAVARAGADPQLASALRAGDRDAVRQRAAALLARERLARLVLERGGRVYLDVGARPGVAPAARDLEAGSGAKLGRLRGSRLTPGAYADLVRRITGQAAVVRRGSQVLAASAGAPVRAGRLPSTGTVERSNSTVRLRSFAIAGGGGERLEVVVASAARPGTEILGGERALALAALVAFLALAVTLAVLVSRSLQAQIGRLLQAARRLAAGNFSEPVPTTGDDEFAQLGGEFNKMSRQLEARVDELVRERARLADAVKRVGRTAAANLDRDALLELVVQTAVDGTGAAAGHASARETLEGPIAERTRVGDVAGAEIALAAGDAEARRAAGTLAVRDGATFALARALRRREGTAGRMLGAISVARRDREFTEAERDLFEDLCAQAAVSLENVLLHEQATRQAITDELTGLANHRRFQEVMSMEVERARRYGHPLGLVMLDIDRFKAINDSFGHQQGDVVLREVAQLVRASAREIDLAARYGGEELALTLPQTDVDGAFQAAERLRETLAELEVERLDGKGTLQVTASFGVAALPACAQDQAGLIAAADAALYRAKRAGRNRTERAEPIEAVGTAR